ncbi:MAG: hypothetical protein WCD47_19255 [Candidatus Sulfotelmatobacter sp.]
MNRLWIISALAVLVALPAHSQTIQPPDSENAQRPGRIIATVENDAGEPITQATMCTTIEQNSSCTSSNAIHEDGVFEISDMPLAKIDVYAQSAMQGYWQDDRTAKRQTVTLTATAPTARVVLKLGPKPGTLIVSVSDKATGNVLHSFFVRLIADRASYGSGVGNFAKQPGTSGIRVPIAPATDFLFEVSATGYKNWYYSDASDPSRPVLRLESGEERRVEVQLEP